MIIYNFNVTSFAVSPTKANTPLIVYPYAVFTFPATRKFLKSISRWESQIVEIFSSIKNIKFPLSEVLQFKIKLLHSLTIENLLSPFVAKRFNHSRIITCDVNIVKRYYFGLTARASAAGGEAAAAERGSLLFSRLTAACAC
jgi:hypothetical protein